MRKHQVLAIAALSVLGLLYAQDNLTPKDFAGTWEATFKGKVFCVLKLDAGKELTGTLSAGRISTNDDGYLTDAEPSPTPDTLRILNPKITGRTLLFEFKESGDEDTLKLQLRLTAEGQAELHFVGTERIKPIAFRRAQ